MKRSLILNRWKTPDGTVLISYHTHDFVSHKDANGEEYFIDGGNDYVRRSNNKEPMENMCVYSDDQFSVIRTVLCRGTFDKDGKRVFIPLCNMSNPHIENCITYYKQLFNENGCSNKYMIYYLVELLFRWYSNKYIDEKKYIKIDETCVSKEFVEFTSINGSFKSDIVNCVKKLEDNINDNIHSDKSGIVDSVKKLTDNINAGIHSDKEETIMLIKHIVNLWSDKDSTIKEMLMNWNIK
jgi:hypothetical protein